MNEAVDRVLAAIERWNVRDAEGSVAAMAEDVTWSDPAMPEPARGR